MYRILKGKTLEKFTEKLKELNPDIIMNSNDRVFIILFEEEIIGYAVLGKDKILKDIFIKEERRYSSFGTRLIEFIKNYLSAKGVDEVYLDRYLENAIFFKKVGFKEWSGSLYKVDGLTAREKRKRDGVRSTVLSIGINIFLAGIKIFFGMLGKSKALVADGFHSVSDIVGSVVVLVGIYLGNKPADEEHPYGHGKLESIAGNIIGVILVITAYSLIVENVLDYFRETERLIPENITLVIVLISIAVKYVLYRYKYNIGIRIKNDAVLADAREHKSDVLSSVGVLVGILLSIYVNPIFDLLLSVVVGLIIGKEGLHIIFQTSNNLMDIQDRKLIEEVDNYVSSFGYIENAHDIRMKTSGNMVYLSLHIRLDGKMTIYEGHELSDDIKYSILNKFEDVGDVTIHMDCTI
ncbi:GNAT family N-acetyltransferase [Psychrilyobacter atlanticus]|uniref:GNAT family N-acetyltransferase n=1 Tax=Psychrilyobacter atlanticus TaxID=271091 RepID=UPI00041B1CB1|nr:GNAT family N-acetyltransferase [Psychrilyobacter atlanticus]